MSKREMMLALEDFRRARSRAALEQALARLTGQSAELLRYEDVRRKLKASGAVGRGVRNISISAIVGSVDRTADFTRSFLPKQDEDQERWARVKAAMLDDAGLPPIEVYQIGEAYFVLDGNHRVSIAHQMGATHIQAYVTEVRTKVPLSPDDRPEGLIRKAEYAEFLEHTHLDELRPEADLSVSVPGQYQILEEHIQVHRYFMGRNLQREIPYPEAVTHWYDAVYMPVVQVIREHHLLRNFPQRTEADLYIWLSQHRTELQEALGWEVKPSIAAENLVEQFSPKWERVAARVGERVLHALPGDIDPGPAAGDWRRERDAYSQMLHLFSDILVPIAGDESGWYALDQALEVARHEEGQLLGLHVVPTEKQRKSLAAQALQAEFERRCAAAGIPGKLFVEAGEIGPKVTERGRWASLVVVNLVHPPEDQLLARLSSGFRTMIQHSPTPVLAVPQTISPLGRALLAYDGSPKAEEALFVSTYLARRWHIPLVVVTALEGTRTTAQTLARAQKHLEKRKLPAEFVQVQGPIGRAILETAAQHQCEWIIMGGYGFTPVLQIVLGSAVDYVLRGSRVPVLICR